MTDDRPRCDKCNRRLRPKPKWRYYASKGGLSVYVVYVGPTCRRKLIASGVPESAFEETVPRAVKVDK